MENKIIIKWVQNLSDKGKLYGINDLWLGTKDFMVHSGETADLKAEHKIVYENKKIKGFCIKDLVEKQVNIKEIVDLAKNNPNVFYAEIFPEVLVHIDDIRLLYRLTGKTYVLFYIETPQRMMYIHAVNNQENYLLHNIFIKEEEE